MRIACPANSEPSALIISIAENKTPIVVPPEVDLLQIDDIKRELDAVTRVAQKKDRERHRHRREHSPQHAGQYGPGDR